MPSSIPSFISLDRVGIIVNPALRKPPSYRLLNERGCEKYQPRGPGNLHRGLIWSSGPLG